MEYTKVDELWRKGLNEYFHEIGFLEARTAKRSPTYFMYQYLGMKPYVYQHILFEAISKGIKRIAICKPRQIGISLSIAVLAFWATFLNVFPSGAYKNTKVGIISRSDEQAKKLMNEIKKILHQGDRYMEKKNGRSAKDFFTKMIDKKGLNNKTNLSWRNGCTIKSFAPTDASRGETFDLVLVDEAAFVDKPIFIEVIEPTVSATGGYIILVSTPKGQKGFFFEIFDPFEKMKEHEYKRFWYNWRQNENEFYKKRAEEK